jgi:hypothetical protein
MLLVLIAATVFPVASCDAGPQATGSSPAPSIDCNHPPDRRPAPEDAVELPLGKVAVAYREWHVASRACDTIVVVGGREGIVFSDQPVPWIAHSRRPPGLTAKARLRLVITRFGASGEIAISDVDQGDVIENPYGNLDPGPRWTPGTYGIHVIAGSYVVAEDTFVVAPGAPASIGP